MKRRLLLCMASIMTMSCWSICFADQLPPPVVTALQQRESLFSHSRFVWRLSLSNTLAGASKQQVERMQKAIKTQLPYQVRQHEENDAAYIKKFVEQQVQDAASTMIASTFNSASVWSFERDGSQTLVTGTKQGRYINSQYRQFYTENVGMMINDSTQTTTGVPVVTSEPVVWQSPGDSTRYQSPFLEGLNLLPEDFVMLTGFNPLQMYGADWKLVASTPAEFILTTQIATGIATDFPLSVHMTLSREHDGLPSEISIDEGGWSTTYRALNYTRYNGAWVCDKVGFIDEAPGVMAKHIEWSLLSIKPSGPVELAFTGKPQIQDFRLLGQNATEKAVQNAQTQRDHHVTYYQWKGRVPTLIELTKINNREHPGESSPDPGKSASLPFVGGIMALTGAVWMFKRRGGSSS